MRAVPGRVPGGTETGAAVADDGAGLPRHDLTTATAAADVLDRLLASMQGRLTPELLTRLKELPTMLSVSGLPATLAFYAAKSDPTSQLGNAYAAIGQALRQAAWDALQPPASRPGPTAAATPAPPPPPAPDIVEMIRGLARATVDRRAAASAAVSSLAGWLRRLSEAVARERPPTITPAPTVTAAPVAPTVTTGGTAASGASDG